MAHHVDDRAWPLIRLVQTGRQHPDDIRGLTDALVAAARRADAEARPFVVVLDYRQRDVTTPGGDANTDAFWRDHGPAVARWCAAMIRLDPDDTVTVAHQPTTGSPSAGSAPSPGGTTGSVHSGTARRQPRTT